MSNRLYIYRAIGYVIGMFLSIVLFALPCAGVGYGWGGGNWYTTIGWASVGAGVGLINALISIGMEEDKRRK